MNATTRPRKTPAIAATPAEDAAAAFGRGAAGGGPAAPAAAAAAARELIAKAAETASRVLEQQRILAEVASRQAATLLPFTLHAAPDATGTAAAASATAAGSASAALAALARRPPHALAQEAAAYALDAAQRWVLFWDAMRRAGNAFVEHERDGCPPVLVFDYETVVDGRTLPRPVNYALVRILVPADAPPTDPRLRPFVIIDPRAGHGAGIGGFKSDSQVGVALRRGHPVYFVIFFRDPEPGQTILDVTAAEATFLRAIHDRHPEAPKPVVIGNCQGGWAVMMLGAAEPDLTGPLVLNGAPLSYWAGTSGRNPMRYLGGLAGGSWPSALLADLGDGRFDGANLVLNFESLSPGNAWFRKYYDVFAKADTETDRFLEFERWWGGFYLMNADEIRWIVDNLFIGDRFARGRMSAGPGAAFDMRAVRSPVIVFASAGDNITPPGQALRWIADIYRDEQEIKALGQTIVYLVHEDIGHLGIFVSGKVARKEHTEIATTLEMIEAVAPGLYEMRITEREGPEPGAPRQVELVERRIEDIRALSGEASNEAFPAVAKISALNEHLYDVLARPVIRQVTTAAAAEARRQMHPLRVRRYAFSDLNPFMAPVAALATMVKAHRAPAGAGNAFAALETAWADGMERSIDAWRDWRDAWAEGAFHAVYGALAALGVTDEAGAAGAMPAPTAAEMLAAPEVRAALARTDKGGYAEAVIRMMILLARARGAVRRTRLARSNALLQGQPPFSEMTPAARQAMIREQTVIVTFAPEEALAALPLLLPGPEERARAMAAVEQVAGPEDDLGEAARTMLQRLRATLGVAAAGTAAAGTAAG